MLRSLGLEPHFPLTMGFQQHHLKNFIGVDPQRLLALGRRCAEKQAQLPFVFKRGLCLQFSHNSVKSLSFNQNLPLNIGRPNLHGRRRKERQTSRRCRSNAVRSKVCYVFPRFNTLVLLHKGELSRSIAHRRLPLNREKCIGGLRLFARCGTGHHRRSLRQHRARPHRPTNSRRRHQLILGR